MAEFLKLNKGNKMATSKDIKNKALFMIGSQPETDFTTSQNKRALICNEMYPLFKEKMISMNRWNFAKKRIKIDGVNVLNQKYKKEFAIPNDFIRILGVYIDPNYRVININYELLGNNIYADVDSIYIYYIANVDEDLMPVYFIDLLATAFASEISFYLTGDKGLTEILNSKAFGSPASNGHGGLYALASTADAKQNMPQIIMDNPLISVRHGG